MRQHTAKENLEVTIKMLSIHIKILIDYYYNRNTSVVSDQEFDMLVKRLEVLEKEYAEASDE